ncbi:M14 family metallopeptidase, partial [bacterium]|nr:M14 family metallopeptidase [bacterium]
MRWQTLFLLALSSLAAHAAKPPYFFDTYDQCRNAFRVSCAQAIALSAVLTRPDQDNDLTIDSCLIQPRVRRDRLVVLVSGVHGVEGPVGSAVQSLFLREILPQLDRERTGVLLIH